MKTCSSCNVEKELDSFYKDSTSKGGYRRVCKVCFSASRAEYRKTYYSTSTNAYLHKYKMTQKEFDQMLVKQNYVCAVCKQKSDQLYVDHDHDCCPGQVTCGRCVRGLLCRNCNLGEGYIGSDPMVLFSMIEYKGWDIDEALGRYKNATTQNNPR